MVNLLKALIPFFHKTKTYVLKIVMIVIWICGISFICMIILSLTDIPFYAYYGLSALDQKLDNNPDVIMVLGGTGMPSPDGLIRLYYTAEIAKEFKESQIVLAQPENEPNDTASQLNLMRNELVCKGIDTTRIIFESEGYNTRTQALNIASIFRNSLDTLNFYLITSPQHMLRAVRTFKKLGFRHIGSLPTFENPIEEQKLKAKKKDKMPKLLFRYNMWSYLEYELKVLREYCAIVYYKLRGWI